LRFTKRYALALILALALLNTACPTSKDLDTMAKASQELAHDVLLANQVTAEVYKAKSDALIAKFNASVTPEEKAAVKAQQVSLLATKDKIADKLGIIGDKGEKFNNRLIDLDKKYPQGTLPPQDLTFVKQNLSELRQLYTDVLADLLPLKAQKAVSSLDKHLTTIEKVVNK
jgi:hypothetical protein